MHVGICRLSFHLPEAFSLKDKRQVARSISARVRNKFNVAVAEVADTDRRQLLTIGICCVSNERGHVDSILSQVLEFVEESRLDAVLVDINSEIISGV